MAKRKQKKSKSKLPVAVVVIIVIILAAILVMYYLFPEMFNGWFGDSTGGISDTTDINGSQNAGTGGTGDTDSSSGSSSDTTIAQGDIEDISSAELSIHFLELGNKYTGDCTLIKCGDTEVLIDAGSRTDSAATISAYIDTYCTDGVLEYVIATHAHQDHIAGFVGKSDSSKASGMSGILYNYTVETLIQFARTDITEPKETSIYSRYCTAVEYAQNNGTTVYTALQCWNNANGAQRTYYLDSAQTISMNILYNYFYENTADSDGGENEYSVCMLLTQQTEDGENNYLFTGDLEEKGEEYLVQYNSLPQVELFKGGHHGSYTASTEALLSVIQPKYVAVCCCCGTKEYTKVANSEHSFPAQEFIDRVGKYTDKIYCTTLITDYDNDEYTSMNGNIVFYYSEDKIKLWCSNNTTILRETDWFKANRTWSGVTG